MTRRAIFKTAVDVAMAAAMPLLMAYSMLGEAAHEWLGIGAFALFTVHHILNRRWSAGVLKGRYAPFRIWQTFLAAGVLISMLGAAYGGIVLSEHALAFLPIKGGRAAARAVHMLSAYWGFVLLSLHMGLHWTGAAKRLSGKTPAAVKWILFATAALSAIYGASAFWKRGLWHYMTLKSRFVFFDFEEPLALFLIDYAAIMIFFAVIGCILSVILKRAFRKKPLDSVRK